MKIDSYTDGFIHDIRINDWVHVMNVNFIGAFLCCKYIIPIMIRQNYGKIFNIASLKGVTGSPCQSNYATSKAAIIGFSKSLAKEVGKNNIVVNAICPGFVETDLNKGDQIKKENARRQSLLDYRHALDDYVNFMIYAISDRFQGISGQVFHLDSRI